MMKIVSLQFGNVDIIHSQAFFYLNVSVVYSIHLSKSTIKTIL